MELIFAKFAFRQLQKLDHSVQRRIMDKLRFFVSRDNPLRFADHLVDPSVGEWRFRVGDWRIMFDVRGTKMIILQIGHRSDIYR